MHWDYNSQDYFASISGKDQTSNCCAHSSTINTNCSLSSRGYFLWSAGGFTTMKVGFQLKNSSKRKVILAAESTLVDLPADDDAVRIESIVSIEDMKVKSTTAEKGPLVIPLQLPLNASLSIDEIAARELLADVHNPGGSEHKDSGLVIEAKGNATLGGKRQPLLLANVAPELLKIEDDVERYKKDISMRPQDIDAKSDAYISVPIEEFGAALLRGMGWAGPTTESEEKDKKGYELVVRESRLGLGATAKPPEDKSKKSKGHKTDKVTEEWKRKADEAIKKQQLQVGDLVWLRDPLYVNRNARVEAVRGVPGLDRIRVALVDVMGPNGEMKVVDVKRTDAVLTASGEDKCQSADHNQSGERGAAVVSHSRSGDRDRRPSDSENYKARDKKVMDDENAGRHRPSKDEKYEARDSYDKDRHNRKRPREEVEVNRHIARSKESDGRTHEQVLHRADRNEFSIQSDHRSKKIENDTVEWIRAGIRVRVISEKLKCSHQCYLKKFDVMSLSSEGLATIRQIDDGFVVEHVKEKYVENVLPAINQRCILLLGRHKGKVGTLREKNKQKEELLIDLENMPHGEDSLVRVSLEGAAAVADS